MHMGFVGPRNINFSGTLACDVQAAWSAHAARLAAAQEKFGDYDYPHGAYDLKSLNLSIFGKARMRDDIDVRIDSIVQDGKELEVQVSLFAGRRVSLVRKFIARVFQGRVLTAAIYRQISAASVRLAPAGERTATSSQHVHEMLAHWASLAVHVAVRVAADYPSSIPVTAKLILTSYESCPEGAVDWTVVKDNYKLCPGRKWSVLTRTKKRVPNCAVQSFFEQRARLPDGSTITLATGSVKIALLSWNPFFGLRKLSIKRPKLSAPCLAELN